jgi:hypothetical protein
LLKLATYYNNYLISHVNKKNIKHMFTLNLPIDLSR